MLVMVMAMLLSWRYCYHWWPNHASYGVHPCLPSSTRKECWLRLRFLSAHVDTLDTCQPLPHVQSGAELDE